MRLLLDTQAVIWSLENGNLLSVAAKESILSADEVFISPVNFYEIVIKLASGKDVGVTRPVNELINLAANAGFTWLPIMPEHIDAYTILPLYEDHRDPFDRMILATALADELTVVSSDRNFPRYNNLIPTIW